MDRGHYATSLLSVYVVVTSYGCPNFCGARVTIPINLHLKACANICHTEDAITLSYLTLGFPASYEGQIPTPSYANHSSAIIHSRDVTAYITKDLGEGHHVGSIRLPPFHP